MNVVLLGGSNSVMTYGLRSGLKADSSVNLLELALGATSSLQNLYALIKNHELVESAHLIVTESNVNDSYNVTNIDIPLEDVLKNIDRFYSELSHVKCPVVVLLNPLNFDKKPTESLHTFTQVNQRHLDNIEKYGFDFINLVDYIPLTLKAKNQMENFDYIVPDVRHPRVDFIHDLGNEIIKYYKNIELKKSQYKPTNSYKVLSASVLDLSIEQKGNSRFTVDILKINQKYFFPEKYYGYKMLGVATWGGSIKQDV